ncbi:MAG: nickel-dependent hydrogenase large subunit [Desulfobacterales bacterium]|nr:nickel-dependent hydrogenase large subunit [Desulfobacterales bacterium]
MLDGSWASRTSACASSGSRPAEGDRVQHGDQRHGGQGPRPGPLNARVPLKHRGEERDGMSGQAEGRVLLVRFLRRLRRSGRRPGRGDPRRRRRRRHRALAGGHGLQAERHRGHARRVASPSRFINGAIRTSEQEEMAPPAAPEGAAGRSPSAPAPTSAASPAWPTCTTGEQVFDTVYQDVPVARTTRRTTRPAASTPGRTAHALDLPGFYDDGAARWTRSSTSTTTCPAARRRRSSSAGAIEALLTGNLPPKGAVLGPEHGAAATTARARTASPTRSSSRRSSGRTTHIADPETVLPRPGLHLHGPGHPRRLRQPPASRATCRARGCFGPDWTMSATRAPSSCRPSRRSLGAEDRSRDRQAARPDPRSRRARFYRFCAAERRLPASRTDTLERPHAADAHHHRPHHAPRRPRQDRDLPRRPGRGGQRATSRSRSCAGSSGSASGAPPRRCRSITQRICGVCPTAHHMASAKALDDLYQVDPPPAAHKIRELVYNALHVRGPRAALLLPGRAGLHRRARRRRPAPAQHRGRHRQGRPRDRRQGDRHARKLAREFMAEIGGQGHPPGASACPAA